MRVLALICVLCAAAPVQAQVVNPTTVTFTPSADHNVIGTDGQPVLTRYELRLYFVGSSSDFVRYDLGKPAPTNGAITVTNPAWFVGSANGQVCEARVAAIGPAGTALSDASNTYVHSTVAPPAKGIVGLIAKGMGVAGAGLQPR